MSDVNSVLKCKIRSYREKLDYVLLYVVNFIVITLICNDINQKNLLVKVVTDRIWQKRRVKINVISVKSFESSIESSSHFYVNILK